MYNLILECWNFTFRKETTYTFSWSIPNFSSFSSHSNCIFMWVVINVWVFKFLINFFPSIVYSCNGYVKIVWETIQISYKTCYLVIFSSYACLMYKAAKFRLEKKLLNFFMYLSFGRSFYNKTETVHKLLLSLYLFFLCSLDLFVHGVLNTWRNLFRKNFEIGNQ